MSASEGRSPASPDAAKVFLEYLSRRAAGELVDFERLCAERPDLAPELRRRFEPWLGIVEALGRRVAEQVDRGSGTQAADQVGRAVEEAPAIVPHDEEVDVARGADVSVRERAEEDDLPHSRRAPEDRDHASEPATQERAPLGKQAGSPRGRVRAGGRMRA
jgi:hypothetical protein